MRTVIQIVIGTCVLVAIIVVLVLLSRRATRKFDAFLASRGFTAAATCPEIVVSGRVLEGVRCFDGEVAPGAPATLFIGFVKVPSRRGAYTRYLGVRLPASPPRDDAWLRRWEPQVAAAYRAPDGGVVIAWELLDTPANAERVLGELAR
jgi:hypothetical protein